MESTFNQSHVPFLTSQSCNISNDTIFLIVACIRGFSGFVSCLAGLWVIILIILLRKYTFHIQRLILYLGIGSVMSGLTNALQILYRHPTTEPEKRYCASVAFFDQISDWSVYLATLIITIHLYLKAVHNKTVKLEILSFAIIFILPLTLNWVPFLKETYGPAGPWCWIQLNYPDTCHRNTFGYILRIVLWYVPSNVILAIIIILYVIMLISLRRQKRQYKCQYSPEQEQNWKMKVKEVRLLIWYPLLLLLVQIPAMVNRLVEIITDSQADNYYFLWFIAAIFSPIHGGLMCLAYALDPETRSRIRRCSWRSLRHQFNTNSGVHDYPVEKGFSDSIDEDQKEVLLLRTETMSLVNDSNQSSFKTFQTTDY